MIFLTERIGSHHFSYQRWKISPAIPSHGGLRTRWVGMGWYPAALATKDIIPRGKRANELLKITAGAVEVPGG